MNHKRPPIPVIVILLIVIAVSAYFIYTQSAEKDTGALTASGFIESTQVNAAPELAGKVTEVLVEEGQPVRKGDALLRLDPSLLTAQRAVASAAVDSANAALAAAQTKYDQALEAALAAQAAQRPKDWQTAAPSEFDQPNWYIDQDQQIAAAQAELDAARKAIDEAQANLDRVISDLKNSEYLDAERELADARAAFVIAKQVKDDASKASDSGGLNDAAQDYYDDALSRLDDAEEAYNDLLNSDEADDVGYARGQVLVAQQRYDAAYSRLLALQTGEQSPAVIAAAKELDKAKSALSQAEASLALIDAQMAKLEVRAPMDGIVLTRVVEPGEFVQPGATALTLADLGELTITVYIPEPRINEIQLGQRAKVTIDTASGESPTFDAEVIHIADQAEFTPRNVQTVEGRSSTVFAVRLTVIDPQGMLKIGMPADVEFIAQP